jgi:glucan phosphoethanolaminetransferase (alkaline phosphatase superfamily)
LAIGFAFGLGKGLFVLAPALLLSFVGARAAFARYPAFGILTAGALIASSLFHAHIYNNPDGSECWSVRYLLHLTVLLVLPAWYGFEWARKSEWRNGLAFIALAVGAFFSALSLMAPNALEYTQAFAESKPQKSLLLSWSDGQLARRATNVSLWLSGEPMDHSSYAPHLQSNLTTLTNRYMPNLWPWVLARKFPQSSVWIWIAWLGTLAGCARLFWLSTRPVSEPPRRLKLL